MTSVNLSILLSRGRELKTSFDRLGPDLVPSGALLSEIEAWLKECLDYGRFLPDPSPDRRALQSRVDFWTSLLARSGHPLPDIDRIADFDPEAGLPLEVAFPYPGLAAYGEKQQGLFCGREHDTIVYSAHLEQHPALLLVSESGGGKSSLAMAGILPKLKEAHPDWLFATRMTPGSHPIEALSSVLREVLPALPVDFLQDAATKSQAAARLVLDTLDGRMLLIFVDQLEELLTLCNDAQQQADFAALLSALAEGGNCRVLVTMRSDHQHQLANSQTCRLLFVLLAANEGVKTLAPLGFDQIRTAILTPAQAVGLRFVPPEIVDELARQTANLVGGLPLLQFALWRLWESRPIVDGRPLDLINGQQLQALPNVQEALGTAAEAQYKDLPPASQAVCKRLMMELTIPAENFEDPMRRRRRESEVVQVLLKHGQAEVQDAEKLDEVHISELINRFVDARLLVQSGEGENKQIEVAHESIFRNWSTFRDWVSGEEAKARLQAIRLIAREAAQWADQGRAADYLKQKGAPLARALDYEKEGWLVDPAVTDYLEACQLKEEEEKERQQQLDREKERAQRAEMEQEAAGNKKRRAYVVTGFVGLIALISWFAWYKYTQQQKTAALNSLPLLAASLPPGEALAVVQSVAKKGGEGFRYVLAHSLERMYETQLLGEPHNSSVSFEGQGTSVFQLDISKTEDKKLKVFRVCDTGGVDKASFEVSIGPRQYLQAGIGPSSPEGDRIIVMVFPNEDEDSATGLNLKAYSLSWPVSSPCESDKPAEQPKLASTEQMILGRQIRDDKDVSSIAFDPTGQSAVFSTLRYPPSRPPQSTLWQLLRRESKDWEFKELEIQTQDGSDPSESTVSTVAFRGSNGSEPVEERLITGRLNGTIYCGSKLLKFEGFNPDPSPVKQISSHLDSGESDWFAYRQESGRVAAWKCEGGEPFVFLESAQNVSYINLNRLMSSSERPHVTYLVTYIDDKQWKCWTWGSRGSGNKEGWHDSACNVTPSVDYMAISPNARRMVTIEGGESAAIHRFPLQLVTEPEKHFVGRLAANSLILWNRRASGNDKPTDWQRFEPEDGFKYFEPSSLRGSEIGGAALSPSGTYLVWIGIVNSEYKVSRFETSGQHREQVWTGPSINAIAVDDNGLTAIAIGDILELYDSQSSRPTKPDLPVKGQRISCLGFSPNNKNLVVGTATGNLWLLKKEQQWQAQARKSPAPIPSIIQACAVSNDGTIVGGGKDGSVWVFKPDPSSTPIRLSQRAIYQLAVPVKAVSLEEGQDTPQHVAALWEWQANDCTRPGLPGQAVQVWDLHLKLEDQPPVSTMCFPNQWVTTIGSVRLSRDNSSVQLPVVFDEKVQLIPCRGCSRDKEISEAMLKRLMDEARQVGAQNIDDKKLATTYGIGF